MPNPSQSLEETIEKAKAVLEQVSQLSLDTLASDPPPDVNKLRRLFELPSGEERDALWKTLSLRETLIVLAQIWNPDRDLISEPTQPHIDQPGAASPL